MTAIKPQIDTQFNANQIEQVRALLDSFAWVDVHYAMIDVKNGLRLALEATSPDFWRWEEAAEANDVNEFCVTPYEVARMSDRERLAYVARLLRTIAGQYGLRTEFGGSPGLGELVDDHSPAGLLQAVDEIRWLASRNNRDGER
jgi:hypothetical protein